MSATSSAINPKGPRTETASANPIAWACDYLCSSVGQKILVAITGTLLVTFVLFHMIGNLKMFVGPESINKYAYFLKHDLGALIWIARGGLLGCFLLHLTIALWLKSRAAAARPTAYAYTANAQATPASKTMVQTGLVVGVFVLFHLAHYTFGTVHTVPSPDGKGETNYLDLQYRMPDGKMVHNVYAMVVAGFSTPWISVVYLLCQVVLFVHLSHGIQSAFQTLGLVNRRFVKVARALGIGIAGAIVAGNFAIVIAVWGGWVKNHI
jgi:succinate dehydrogenase / fumarate reductase, cytochrome b subunit